MLELLFSICGLPDILIKRIYVVCADVLDIFIGDDVFWLRIHVNPIKLKMDDRKYSWLGLPSIVVFNLEIFETAATNDKYVMGPFGFPQRCL